MEALVIWFILILYLTALDLVGSFVSLYRNRDKYYYQSLDNKMGSILHGKCSYLIQQPIQHAKVMDLKPPDNLKHTIYVYPSPIEQEIQNWYLTLPVPKQMRVDPTLCTIVSTYKRPIFNNTGCQLRHYMSLYAPRCQVPYIKHICYAASLDIHNHTHTGFVLPESNHALWKESLPPLPYVLVMQNVFVSQCGQVSLPCGFIHPSTNCHTTGYYSQALRFNRKCTHEEAEKNRSSGIITCLPAAPFDQTALRLHESEEVFIIGQVDDTYTYHIHLELLPRLVYYLPLLMAKPHMKIMYGCDRKKGDAVNKSGLRAGIKSLALFMDYFNITNPLVVQQHVFAHGKVYMPMEGACQDPVYNTWQILYMRDMVLKHIDSRPYHRVAAALSAVGRRKQNNVLDYHPYPYNTSVQINFNSNSQLKRKKVMLLLQRTSSSSFTRNSHDLVRQWNDIFTYSLLRALDQSYGGEYEVRVLSDQNLDYMNCFVCQAALLADTDVLIGMHGAGLGLMLYMPPNKAVIEIAPYANDGRCLLGAGPFSRLATLTSLNYMIHYPRKEEFIWKRRTKSAEFNISRLITHTTSFLTSIGFLSR